MAHKPLLRVTVTILFVVPSLCGLLFLLGYVGNTAARVKREHGLKLPSSASGFICRGDAWMHSFMDSGAASALEMDSKDLISFTSQLKIRETYESDTSVSYKNGIFPLNR